MTAPPQPGQASPGTVKTRRKMAVTSLILSIILPILLPAGITALVFSFRVKSSLAAGDIGRARQASSRVAIAFWIIIVIWVMVIIIYAYLVIHAASGSTAAAAASRSSLR
jgi:heme/copper-type cytochrome/quinol oxidase subunit 2